MLFGTVLGSGFVRHLQVLFETVLLRVDSWDICRDCWGVDSWDICRCCLRLFWSGFVRHL
jgi:hypothetical protein